MTPTTTEAAMADRPCITALIEDLSKVAEDHEAEARLEVTLAEHRAAEVKRPLR